MLDPTGPVLIALAAALQQGGATKGREDGEGRSRGRRLLAVLENPRWLAGTGLFVVAIAVQLSALLLAPLALVQPIGPAIQCVADGPQRVPARILSRCAEPSRRCSPRRRRSPSS